MPRKKSEFKPLTYQGIVKQNPERKTLSGSKANFKKLIDQGTKQKPFDKQGG